MVILWGLWGVHSWKDTGLHSKQINFLIIIRKARFYTCGHISIRKCLVLSADWVTGTQEQKGTTENKHCSIDTRQFTQGKSKENRCSRWGKKD